LPEQAGDAQLFEAFDAFGDVGGQAGGEVAFAAVGFVGLRLGMLVG